MADEALCSYRSDSPSKQELMAKVAQLNDELRHLRALLAGNGVPQCAVSSADGAATSDRPVRNEPKRAFDFSRYKRRHVAFKLLYLGWHFQGYVTQEDTENTVEHHLFEALAKTKLIENRESSNYHRCGRTDKGVSAFSQVVSLDVRCNAIDGIGVFTPDNYSPIEAKTTCEKEELNYCKMLNRVLPPEIRCIAWSPVAKNFSARFDCKTRTYKYFFPIGNLNLEQMKAASKYLIGEHDFRNICKMDVNNGVTNYKRRIISVDFEEVTNSNNGYNLFALKITGQAFLWHQVRCIVALLFLVGERNEEPEIVSRLLNVEETPNKPQYSMAVEFPLVLFECQYDSEDVSQWTYDDEVLTNLIHHLQGLWCREAVKTALIKSMLDSLECKSRNNGIKAQTSSLTMGVKRKLYVPLMKRPVCESLEDKILKSENRKKLKLSKEIPVDSITTNKIP